MLRESSHRAVALALGLAMGLGGCSLALDFSDKAIPKDATPDGPFPQDECAFGEPNDTAATATPLITGTIGNAAICPAGSGAPDDQDFYKFTVPSDAVSVTVEIHFRLRPTGDLDIKLLSADGSAQIAQSRGFGDSESITCPGASPACAALAPDDYVLQVFPAVPGQTNDYYVTLSMTLSGSGSGSGSGSAL